jgi:transcriptional regulator with XRE-family HTH domain
VQLSPYAYRVTTLGRRIAEARGRVGLSQQALANELGVGVMTVSKWERDRMEPGASNLRALSTALGVAPGWLLTGEAGAVVDSHAEAPPHWAEFVERYAHIAEFSAQQLHDLQRFYDRHGKRPQSWTDWERLAEIVRTSQPSARFAAASKNPKQ